jgi:MFS family permease
MQGDADGHGSAAAPRGPVHRSGWSGHNVRDIMRVPGFRRLLIVRLLGQMADGLFQAGLAGSVLFNPQHAASPGAIAAGFAVLLLPYSLIGPYVGVMLDRWSRRTVLVATNLLRSLLILPAVAMIWGGAKGAPFVLTALLIIGLSRLFLSAIGAATPHVVDDARLVTANAVTNTLGSIGFSVGLGGVALLVVLGLPPSFHGYAAVAALAPLGYLASAVLARRSFSATELGPDATRHRHPSLIDAAAAVGHRTADGIRHLAGRRIAGYALLAQAAHRTLYGVLTLATLLLYRETFAASGNPSHSVTGLGGAFAAGGLGMFTAAFVTPAIARRIGGWRWITLLLAVTGVAIAAFGLSFQSALLPFAVGWVSAASQGTKIVVDTALQHECDDDYRGRVFSVNDTLFNLCFVAGVYLGALTLPDTGRSTATLLSVAFGYLAVTLWYAIVGGQAARQGQGQGPRDQGAGAHQPRTPAGPSSSGVASDGALPAGPQVARWASAR